MARNNQVTGWVGWVYFAGYLMMLAGIFQSIAGLTALLKSDFFVVRASHLVVFSYTTWGWVHLLAGVIIMLAGMAVLSGQVWGRVIAVFLALFSIVANFVFLPAYPIWSIAVIVADVLIVYALTVHGAEARE
jgi:hypothetical protein